MASRHRNVHLGPKCRICPTATVRPRDGKIVIGAGCRIAPGAIVQGTVTLGARCSVQAYSIIIGEGEQGINIGNGVMIAPHVAMFSANHIFADASRMMRDQGMAAAPIIIEDDVWIASGARIMAGVTVGKRSVIAAGAVVTRNVQPCNIVGGVPARVTGQRGSA